MSETQRKSTSVVWKYFEIKENDGKKSTECQLCRTVLAYHGGTSAMRAHLIHKHPSLSLVGRGNSQLACGLKVSTMTQPTLANSWAAKAAKPLAQSKQEEITRNIALMCAVDVRPMSIVDGVGFRHLLQSLNPGYKIPCRNTVTKYLHKLYDDEKVKVVSAMKDLSINVTSDIWTSVSNDGYISFTGHFIDNNWNLCAKTLASRHIVDRHTGRNIASALNRIAADFEIEDIPCLITDNASNMTLAAKEAGLKHSGCFAHTLQLCIEDGLKISSLSKALGASRRLVAHFNRSVLSTQALRQKQCSDSGDSNALKLIQDVQTRWNSSYFMMDRLLKLRVPVYAVLFDDQITNKSDRASLDIKDCHWQILEKVCPVLKPFVDATEILSKEDLPTGSAVYILLHDLMTQHLVSTELDAGIVSDLKTKIKEGLMKRFNLKSDGTPMDSALKSPLLVAMALDPRFKQLKILSPPQRDSLHQTIVEMLEQGASGSTSLEPENVPTIKQEPDNDEPVSKKPKPFFTCLTGDICDLTESSTAEKELNDFCVEPVRIPNPLDWWKMSEKRYPAVAKLAKAYLSIPGTSVPSERVFSVAGMTLTKLRSNLDPDTLDEIIFLNKNLKHDLKNNVCQNFEPLPTFSMPDPPVSDTSATIQQEKATVKKRTCS